MTPAEASWRWESAPLAAGLERWAGRWDDLALRSGASPTAGAAWMGTFWRAFVPSGARVTLQCLFDREDLVAILPLRRKAMPWRAWSGVVNVHTTDCAFPLDLARQGVAAEVIRRLLASADVIDLWPLMRNGPLCGALVEGAASLGLRTELTDLQGDAVIDLEGSWERFRGRMSRNLREGTERKMRALERRGSLRFDLVTGGEGLDGVLEECFELESLGWKALAGSPIASRASTHQFYRELAREASLTGRFALFTLRLDGRLIAFEYCLRAGQRIVMLKLSFDPAWSAQSPGNVLRLWVLRREIEHGRAAVYHLGPQSDWKMRWATRVEPMVRLRIYAAGPRGRFAYALGPRLRRSLKRSAVVRRVAAEVRRRLKRDAEALR